MAEDVTPIGTSESPTHVVIIVHGIRDFALWQTTVGAELEDSGLKVEPINYGRFNLLEFILPTNFFRRRAIETVWRQIRIVRQNNPTSRISIIAHSFGTYVVSHLLKQNFDISFHRIIFCGSVVEYGFEYEQFQSRFLPPIINEVGTRDVWPAIAESVTFGYGSAGTYGFRRPLVRDRWHNGAKHGYFLNRAFCANFWVTFLQKGTIVPGAAIPDAPRFWLTILSVIKIKYVAIALLCGIALQSYLGNLRSPLPQLPKDSGKLIIPEIEDIPEARKAPQVYSSSAPVTRSCNNNTITNGENTGVISSLDCVINGTSRNAIVNLNVPDLIDLRSLQNSPGLAPDEMGGEIPVLNIEPLTYSNSINSTIRVRIIRQIALLRIDNTEIPFRWRRFSEVSLKGKGWLGEIKNVRPIDIAPGGIESNTIQFTPREKITWRDMIEMLVSAKAVSATVRTTLAGATDNPTDYVTFDVICVGKLVEAQAAIKEVLQRKQLSYVQISCSNAPIKPIPDYLIAPK